MEVGWKRDGKEAARHYNWELDPIGLLCKDSKVQVLYKANLRQKILIKNDNNPLGGHYGLTKTVELLLYKYYQLKLRQKTKKYISYYKKYQVYKIHKYKLQGLLKSVPPTSEPWQYYAIDFIMDLPPSKNEQGQIYNSVLILINRFLKYVQYLPVRKIINI